LGPAVIGGVVVPLAVVLRRRARLDALFVPLGLLGGAYQTRFRQYHGEVEGRQVDVYFARGPVLEIEAGTSLQTRLGVTDGKSDARFLAGLMGRRPLEGAGAPDDLTLFAADEAWAGSLLADPDVADLLRRLTALGSSLFTRQQVVLRPGTFALKLSGNRRLFKLDLAPQQVRAWLDDLLSLVQAAERLPAPQVTDELTAGERSMAKLRRRNPYLALWVGLGFVAFFLVAAVVITGAVFLMASMRGGL
jgi:hypothetical protein